MAGSFKTFSTSKFLLSLFIFFSSLLFSEELFLRKCETQYLGTWVELNTLNRFEFDSDCGFSFQGAGCSVSGEYFSSETTEGSLMLLNKVAPANSTCFSKGEQSCTFKFEKNTLTLKCPTKQTVTYVRQIRRAVANAEQKEVSGTAKTLLLLQTGPTESLKAHLEKLSDEDVVEATTALGYNHFYGSRGFKQDYVEALYWNRLAASKGSHVARVLVGTQYLYGLGVPKDGTRAEEFFILAAKGNDVVPHKALAGMYLMKPNQIDNREKAIYWLTQAIKLGDNQAKEFLSSLKPQEKRNLRTFCALFDQYQGKKPETPVAKVESHTKTSEAKAVITLIQADGDTEASVETETNQDSQPMEPARCLASGYVPASHYTQNIIESSPMFWIGGGPTNLGIQSSATTFDNYRFLVSFKTVPFLVWGGLNVQGNFDYAVPLTSQVNSLSFSQIEGKLSYDLPVTTGFSLKPSFSYLRMQFEDSTTKLGIVGGQLGLGLGAQVVLDNTWSLNLSGMTLAAGRGAIVSGSQTLNMSLMQSNHAINLFVMNNGTSSNAYGMGLQLQQISLLGSKGDAIRLSQYSGQFFYNF